MLTVHHLSFSQSERIIWLCEELDIPCNIARYERDSATRLAPPKLKALHPFGTAPVISDGAVLLGESGAIVDYIFAKYGSGDLALSADHPDFANYLYWLHFANGSFIPAVMMEYALQAVGAQEHDNARNLRARGDLALEISEQRLGEATFFAGESFTAADIMMVLPLQNRRDLSGWPNIQAYLQRILERPAYQRAMKKA